MSDDSMIWTEKYRPTDFSQIVGQEHIIPRVKAFVEKKNLPHMLFAGPAGVGKTTLALVIARKLFGNSWRRHLLELNASDSRGIDVIRNQVKDFARTKAIGKIPFKLIYLDESDALTRDAQQALRRTMELFTKTCRFILSCNFSSKIIDPIQSRCAIFRFKPLPEEALYKIINTIAQKEGLEIDEQAKKELINVSGGDCRKLTNILQSCSVLSKRITMKDVYEIISYATPTEIKSILETALKGDFLTARKLLLDTMLRHGLSGQDMIKQIHQTIWQLPIKEEKKVKLIERCAEIEFRLTEGSDEFLQLEALLAQFALVGKV